MNTNVETESDFGTFFPVSFYFLFVCLSVCPSVHPSEMKTDGQMNCSYLYNWDYNRFKCGREK